MKQPSTLFLRLAIIVIGFIAIAFGIFIVPAIGADMGIEFPTLRYLRYPVMIAMYAAAIPFFIMLYQGWKLLNFIDKNTAFSHASVQALQRIKRCAIAIGVIYAALVPTLFYPIAEIDDAPGVIVMGMIIAGTPFVFAVFVAVLKKLLQNAIAFKSENEFTI